MAMQPQQLGEEVDRGYAAESAVAQQVAGALLRPPALLGGTVIEPDQGVAQAGPGGIRNHGAVDLARQRHSGDVAGVGPGFGEQRLHRGAGGPPPVLGILLDPTGPRLQQRIAGALLSQLAPALVDEDDLDAAGALIDSQYRRHFREL